MAIKMIQKSTEIKFSSILISFATFLLDIIYFTAYVLNCRHTFAKLPLWKKYKKMHRVVQTHAKPDRPCGADSAPSWSGGRHIEVGGDRGAALGGESARGHQVDTQGLLRRTGGGWVRACGMHDVAGRFAGGRWVVLSLSWDKKRCNTTLQTHSFGLMRGRRSGQKKQVSRLPDFSPQSFPGQDWNRPCGVHFAGGG